MAVNVGWGVETANSAPPARFPIPSPTVGAARGSDSPSGGRTGGDAGGPIVSQEGRFCGGGKSIRIPRPFL
jgi:hypothetical protein